MWEKQWSFTRRLLLFFSNHSSDDTIRPVFVDDCSRMRRGGVGKQAITAAAVTDDVCWAESDIFLLPFDGNDYEWGSG